MFPGPVGLTFVMVLFDVATAFLRVTWKSMHGYFQAHGTSLGLWSLSDAIYRDVVAIGRANASLVPLLEDGAGVLQDGPVSGAACVGDDARMH